MSNITDQIKERIDVVEFISAYVQLRKSGRNFVGFCPFHSNTRTPAFYVFPDTQSYHCFGCKASGTVFDFLMHLEGLEFREALEQLARRAGVELRERTEQDEQQDRLRTRLLDINAAAAAFFHHLLIKSPRGEAARAYVAKRRIDSATTEAFQLGYGPADWGALLAYLTDRKGFEPEEIEAAGLIIKHETRGYYDRFRDRLIFPIRSLKGEVIAFGGRALGDAQPKYMNSPQTPLFDKSRVLYGLDLARDTIRSSDATVIVEGYVDVIIAHQHGFRNVVAPLGTALTADHVGAVKKLARTVYLALDADAAGIKATLKGVQTLQANLDGHDVPVPTPQGFIRWERELETEIRIIALPDGKDPDEVIQANPDQWRALMAGARPVMDFYVDALTADLDLHGAKGKAEAVARLAPLVAQIANPVERAHHIQQIARLVNIEERIVREALPTQRPSKAPTPTGAARSAGIVSHETPDRQEDYLLSWLLRYPTARTAVQEKLRRDLAAFPLVNQIIDGTPLELFETIENRAIWQAWIAQPDGLDPEQWAQTLDEALQEQAQRVLQLNLPESQAYRYVNVAIECATILQLRLARRRMAQISQQAANAVDESEQLMVIDQRVQIDAYIGTISTPKRSAAFADLHTLHTS
ncbi:MAG TPA: DNA primase [Roseiflexaceae bacterium]|nr:DNA primase [Roseiflexaceae bacterium]